MCHGVLQMTYIYIYFFQEGNTVYKGPSTFPNKPSSLGTSALVPSLRTLMEFSSALDSAGEWRWFAGIFALIRMLGLKCIVNFPCLWHAIFKSGDGLTRILRADWVDASCGLMRGLHAVAFVHHRSSAHHQVQ